MKHYGYLVLLFVGLVAASIAMTGCEGSGGGSDGGGGDDSLTILGTWTVVSDWRWSSVTFKSDGTIDNVQRSDGALYANAATWEISGNKLVITSDVRDECSYVLTDNTLSVSFPDGSSVSLVR